MQGTTEDRRTFTLGDRTFVLDAAKAEAALAAKRVVGGRATRAFNLLPLRYGWAYELYRSMKANHWEPEDVPMQRDAAQWRSHHQLSDVERWIVRMGIGYFSAAEGIVGDNIIHVVCELVTVPPGGRLDWSPLRARIARQGMRNSNVLAIAPTATIANIVGTSPCIEPTYKNVFAKSNLSGDFIVLNPFLVRDLKAAGLWSPELADQLKYFDGDLEQMLEVPQALRDRYRTAFQIDPRFLIDAAARRQKWIDQSQSLNLFLPRPDMKAMSHMYRRAWHAGLKTTYYLRTLGASAIEKSTVSAESIATVDPAIACSIEAQRTGEECEACQ